MELRRAGPSHRGRVAGALPDAPVRRRARQRGACRLTRTLVPPALRALNAADRGGIEAITRATGLFRADEVAVALEVFDAAAAGSPDYTALAAAVDGRLVGWICWGPTPCTLGTYDLYWMAVDPALQGTGIGTALVAEMERRLAGEARLVVVETAGRIEYAPTRAFYRARGYRPAARIPDFYAPGDDLVVYTKPIAPASRRGVAEAR